MLLFSCFVSPATLRMVEEAYISCNMLKKTTSFIFIDFFSCKDLCTIWSKSFEYGRQSKTKRSNNPDHRGSWVGAMVEALVFSLSLSFGIFFLLYGVHFFFKAQFFFIFIRMRYVVLQRIDERYTTFEMADRTFSFFWLNGII